MGSLQGCPYCTWKCQASLFDDIGTLLMQIVLDMNKAFCYGPLSMIYMGFNPNHFIFDH
uniref:Uncharacterized protein n=1 Tax=Rhizophora mucronata TaxID=61149 RepID=A0A2P2MC70_RHIMU